MVDRFKFASIRQERAPSQCGEMISESHPLVQPDFMSSFLDDIQPLKEAALVEFQAAADLAALEQSKGTWLGTQGRFTALAETGWSPCPRKKNPPPARHSTPPKHNSKKSSTNAAKHLSCCPTSAQGTDRFHPAWTPLSLGRLHPLTQVTEDIVRTFRRLGFAVADGPEIEDEYHCFDALNTPADHPARDTQDTFYVATGFDTTVARRTFPLSRRHSSFAPTPRRCRSA
jgi:phenylalanyl-tRNA synthetase alpha chain